MACLHHIPEKFIQKFCWSEFPSTQGRDQSKLDLTDGFLNGSRVGRKGETHAKGRDGEIAQGRTQTLAPLVRESLPWPQTIINQAPALLGAGFSFPGSPEISEAGILHLQGAVIPWNGVFPWRTSTSASPAGSGGHNLQLNN